MLLLILWPLAELFVAIQVAEAIGVLLMLLLLIASWPLGIWALRAQGRCGLAPAAARGRRAAGPRAREVLDGALIVAGGVLLMVPGFITDVLGSVALLPPTRALLRRAARAQSPQPGGRLRDRRSRRQPEPYDVDSTARDVDQPQLRP